MSQKNHAAAPTQLADTSSALNDYFDVLLQDVTDIADENATVSTAPSEPASESVNTDGGGKMTNKFIIEENDTPVTSENNAVSVAAEITSETSFDIPQETPQEIRDKRIEVSEDVESKVDVSASTEHTVIEVTETKASAEADVAGDEASDDEVEQDVALDAEDYFVEGAPEWASRPFQALEFTVAKIKLVMPLVQLCGILDWKQADLTQMPGHSERFIGVWPNHGTNSKIVDVAKMIVPQRYQNKVAPWEERVSKVVLIDESVWGVVCDEILGVVTLDPREVRWRVDRTLRPWLAGTLIEHMSAIIDGDQFALTLQGEKNEDHKAATSEGVDSGQMAQSA